MDYGLWTDLEMPVITNLTTRAVLADRAELATGVLQRMIGLLNRSALGPGQALVFPRCNAIHTCFMRFPIDVLFLKTVQGSRLKVQGKVLEPRTLNLEQSISGVVVRAVECLPPFRFAWAAGADTVVELPVGAIARSGTKRGELLEISLREISQ